MVCNLCLNSSINTNLFLLCLQDIITIEITILTFKIEVIKTNILSLNFVSKCFQDFIILLVCKVGECQQACHH